MESAQHAIDLEPTTADYWFTLGAIQRHNGSISEAISSFEHSVELDSDSVHMRMRLGECYEEASDLAAAIELYRGAVESWPDDKEARRHLGVAFIVQMSNEDRPEESERLDEGIWQLRAALNLPGGEDEDWAHNYWCDEENKLCVSALAQALARQGSNDEEALELLFDSIDDGVVDALLADIRTVHLRLKAEKAQRHKFWLECETDRQPRTATELFNSERKTELYGTVRCMSAMREDGGLLWLFYRPPGWEGQLHPNAGWMTVCQTCKRRVDYFPVPYLTK